MTSPLQPEPYSYASFYGGISPENFLGIYSGPTNIDAGTSASNAAGSYVQYNGVIYRWDGARWLDRDGIGADIPIHFSFDPFANAEPAEWGKPFPLWGVNVTGDGEALIGLMSHMNQSQLIQVGVFMEMNTEVEIPLIDQYGNPFLDPAIPPCSMMRWDVDSNTDRVEDLTNTSATWGDDNTSCAAYVGNSDRTGGTGDNEAEQRMFSHLFRIEKTPTPHWVLRVNYAWNKLTSSGTPFISDRRTVLVQCLGVSSSNHESQTVDSTITSGPGHYQITKVFWPDVLRSDNSVSATRIGQVEFGISEEYCNVAATTSFYLTTNGLTGGTNRYDVSSYVPFVRPLGDQYFDQDRGTTMTNCRSTSLGMGCAQDGVWQDHYDGTGTSSKLSIQHPDFDEYNMVSRLSSNGSRWQVDVINYDQTANAVTATISGGAATARHVVLYHFGREP